MGNAAGAVDRHDAYTLAHAEDLVRLDLLHIGTHAAVVFAHGNFHALGTGQAFLGRRAQQAARHSADHRHHRTAAAAADGAAGNAADNGTGRRADGYHELQSVFRLLDWGDRVRLQVREDGQVRRDGPSVPGVAGLVRDLTGDWPIVPQIIEDAVQKRAAFAAADVAIAASGTVSLELAANGCPMVIAYDMNRLTLWLMRRAARVDTVTLVNLVSESRVVPEFIGEACRPDLIAPALEAVLEWGFCAEGMGLRIMRYRADIIGGDLTLTSPPSGGTTVTCTLHRPSKSN